MISLNKVMLVGNLTRDPDLRYTPNGRPVCSFGLATNRRWKDPQGNLQEETEFHEIVVWGKLAEIISQILKKGNKAFVEGRLRTRSWEGQDGVKRQRTEIIMENFIPLAPKDTKEIEEIAAEALPEKQISAPIEEEEKKTTKKAKEEEIEDEEVDIDEIPF